MSLLIHGFVHICLQFQKLNHQFIISLINQETYLLACVSEVKTIKLINLGAMSQLKGFYQNMHSPEQRLSRLQLVVVSDHDYVLFSDTD